MSNSNKNERTTVIVIKMVIIIVIIMIMITIINVIMKIIIIRPTLKTNCLAKYLEYCQIVYFKGISTH